MILQKILVFLAGILLLTVIFFPRAIPRILRRVGGWLGFAGRVGKDLVAEDDAVDSPLVKYEIRAGDLLAQKYLIEHQLSDDAELRSGVEEVGGRLVRHARRQKIPYRFFVFESEEPNAFAVPGGSIFVSVALLDLCGRDENLVAGVLAHEIVHIDRKHAIRNLTREAALRVGFRFVPFFRGALLSRMAGGMEQLLTKGYRQDQEFEADRLGCRLARQAGYSADGLMLLLRTLEERHPESSGAVAEVMGYFSTHPPMKQRMLRLRGEVR